MVATDGIEIDREVGGQLIREPPQSVCGSCAYRFQALRLSIPKISEVGEKKQQIAHSESQGWGPSLAAAHGRGTI